MAQSDELLQFVTGLKVITNGNGEEELWLLTNRFQVREMLTPPPGDSLPSGLLPREHTQSERAGLGQQHTPVCGTVLIVGGCQSVFAESDDGHDVDRGAQFPNICGANP